MDNDLSEKRGLPETFPVATFLGITFISPSHGNAVAEFRAGAQPANPMGTVHGGILCDLADAAMGIAFASPLRLDQSFTTLELKINFISSGVEWALKSRSRHCLSRTHRGTG
jgi:uncharacterized protein (TIGR00369 family)